MCLAVLNFAPPVSTIFFDPAKISVDALNDRCKGTMNEALGIEYTALGDNWLEAKMPVNANTIQPLKMLNGGASLALIEILGSMAANLVLDRNRFVALGQAVTCNHLKPANMGEEITARATPCIWDEPHRCGRLCLPPTRAKWCAKETLQWPWLHWKNKVLKGFAAYSLPGNTEITAIEGSFGPFDLDNPQTAEVFVLNAWNDSPQALTGNLISELKTIESRLLEISLTTLQTEIVGTGEGEWMAMVETARKQMMAGIFQKVVLSRSEKVAFNGLLWPAFSRAVEQNPDAFVYCIHHPLYGCWMELHRSCC